MSQTASSPANNGLMLGTIYMVAAQVIFAIVNFVYDVLTNPWDPLNAADKMSSSAAVFWQYLIATIFAVPLILRIGLANLRTGHPVWHEIRALASALGAQVFVFGFASGVPVWQMVGLLLTGPFFVIAGSVLFLGEKLSPTRLGASIVAFIGAFLIVGFGTDAFTWGSLLPVLAAALWSATTVISKYLARDETPESLTLYLLLLIVVNHAIIGIVLGILVTILPAGALPASLSTGLDLGLPTGEGVWWMLFLGLVTAAAQYLLWNAYKFADATYLQPFDDLKLPFNVLLGWIVLSQVPSALFWPGAILIIAASLYVGIMETRRALPGAA
ncbi:MAG: DMT family transporter [Hyphomicrobiaceae bacterium]|nr:DMT family transporter [Hyphomicrobiaceae bacterium]MCC0024813.1 DMT family transporter [Hyphomicrobiaceae bacterium]